VLICLNRAIRSKSSSLVMPNPTTLANFALFDLVDLQLSPRIRDLGKITLYRTGPRAEFTARYPSAGHLLTAGSTRS
jgi:hypothetical protein